MGLTSGMYAGVSGLLTHGEAISVIGNNIANVSTIGFKGARVDFEDSLSQEVATASGPGQVGRGVNIGSVMKNFQQGSFETTTESTDLAIGGNGFFMVSPLGEDINYFTRAGNFRFNQEGYLVDPHGYVAQGWLLDSAASQTGISTIGVPTDVRLENFQSPPEATGSVTMIMNLDSTAVERSTSETDPFFAMYGMWDSTQEIPLGGSRYSYQSTMRVYDDNGSAHNLTVYFDPVDAGTLDDGVGGRRYWEFMVTVDPSEDQRVLDGVALRNTDKAGVLMIGTMTFNPSGQLENMSAFTLKGDSSASGSGTFEDPYTFGLSEWRAADFSENGQPICTANFLGVTNGNHTGPDQTEVSSIEINFGVGNRGTEWNTPGLTAAEVGTDHTALLAIDQQNVQLSAMSSTSFSTSQSTTLFQSQDGYSAGFLQSISVSRDGVVTGRYSNGQVIQHFALTIATFNNQWGLHREGGNLFSETRSSGPALTGLAGTGGRGTVASNSLEQSNVDLATEFVKMIIIERGFQANSKVIRTTDNMLAELIQLKR
jgi:flagellar hook protein FlgE